MSRAEPGLGMGSLVNIGQYYGQPPKEGCPLAFLKNAWRRAWPTIALAVVLFGVVAALPGIDPGGTMRLIPPVRKRLARPAFEVIGVYGAASPAADGLSESVSYADLSDQTDIVDGIIGEWFTVDPTGRLSRADSDGQAVGFARSSGDSVWALVTFETGNPGAGARSVDGAPAYLTDRDVRRTMTGRLAETAAAELYDGLVLDLSGLMTGTTGAADGVSALVAETRRAMGRSGQVLGVVLPALTAPREQAFAVDPAALAAVADWLILQGWGEHWPGGSAGPLGGLEWLSANLDALVAKVPPGQVSLALPAFAGDWPVGGTGAVRRAGRDAAALRTAPGANAADDPASGEVTVTYTAGTGEPRRLWYLDGAATARRVRLARLYGLRGVVLWKLGEEDASWWPALRGEAGPAR